MKTTFKAEPVKPELGKPESGKPEPRAAVNPVLAAQSALAEEMGAPSSSAYVAEPMTLGGSEAPEIAEPRAVKYPAVETMRAVSELPLAPKPAVQKKSGWGFFGRKSGTEGDMRAEPTMTAQDQAKAAARVVLRADGNANARNAAVRATAQPMQKPDAASGDDLFPEHKRDEQFEIPAFLRRQSN